MIIDIYTWVLVMWQVENPLIHTLNPWWLTSEVATCTLSDEAATIFLFTSNLSIHEMIAGDVAHHEASDQCTANSQWPIGDVAACMLLDEWPQSSHVCFIKACEMTASYETHHQALDLCATNSPKGEVMWLHNCHKIILPFLCLYGDLCIHW